MDHIDPLRLKGFQPPMTSEIAMEAKKKLKEAKAEADDEKLKAEDVFDLSDMSKSLPDMKKEAFLEDAKAEISKLDKDSESFVDDATQKLVNSALRKEYGEKLTKNVGYKQMEKFLTKKILTDPRYRPIIENFLGIHQEIEELKREEKNPDRD